MKATQILDALNKQQLKQFCVEQLQKAHNDDIDFLSKVIRIFGYCTRRNLAVDMDIYQAMIQFCYNDDPKIRASVLFVINQVIKKSLSTQVVTQALGSAAHILYSQILQEISNLKRLKRLPAHHHEILKDICNTVETISYFAIGSDDAEESDYENIQNVKVMTDTKLSVDLLIDTIVLPLTNICIKSR